MKLTDIILLSLSAALVIIGTHLTFTGGITQSYPVFMFSVVFLFWYRFRKNAELVRQKENEAKTKSGKKANKKK